MTERRPSRTVTTLAVGVLLLDGVLLAIAGHVVGAAVCGLVALLVVIGWRRYRKTYARMIAEVDADRREMRHNVESIRELLRKHNLNN